LSDSPDTKRGPACGETKPASDFSRNRRSKDGLAFYCKICNNARSPASRPRLHGGAGHYHLRHRYGIGADDFDRMVRDQEGTCAICGRPQPEHGDDRERLASAITCLLEADPKEREIADLARQRARELTTSSV